MNDGSRMDHWVVFGMLARASRYHARTDFKQGTRTIGSRARKWVTEGIGAMEQELEPTVMLDVETRPGKPLPQTNRMSEIDRILMDPNWPFPS